MDDTITFLGDFEHGCKYAPALPCKTVNNNTTASSQDYISKIYNSDEDMRREFKNYTTFFPNPISNTKNNTKNNSKNNNNSNSFVDRVDFVTEIKPPCSVDISNLSDESLKVLQRCQGMTQERLQSIQNHSLKQLRVKHGTKVLVLYAKEALFWSYFVHMKSLFNGLKYLERHNIVQPDMMPLNIVLDERYKRFLLSEFMRTQHANNFYKANYRENLNIVDFYTPPEHIFAHFMLSPAEESHENAMKKQLFKNEDFDARIQRLKIAMDSYFTSIRNSNALDNYMRLIDKLKSLRQMDIDNFVNDIRLRVEGKKESHADKNINIKTFFRQELEALATKANVYTLGATLLECLIISFDQFRQRNFNVVEWSASTENLYNRVLILILRMMRANPYVRIDANEAFKNYESIAKDVRKLYQGVSNSKGTIAPRQNRLTGIIKAVGQHLLSHGPKYVAVALAVYAAQRFKGMKGRQGTKATKNSGSFIDISKLREDNTNQEALSKAAIHSLTSNSEDMMKFAEFQGKILRWGANNFNQKALSKTGQELSKAAKAGQKQLADFTAPKVKELHDFTAPKAKELYDFTAPKAKELYDFTAPKAKELYDYTAPKAKKFIDGRVNNAKSISSIWWKQQQLPLKDKMAMNAHQSAMENLQNRIEILRQQHEMRNLHLQRQKETKQQEKDRKKLEKRMKKQENEVLQEMKKQEKQLEKLKKKSRIHSD